MLQTCYGLFFRIIKNTSYNAGLCSNRFRNSQQRAQFGMLCWHSYSSWWQDSGQVLLTDKPEPEYYNYWCSKVHGLCASDTDNAPIFPEVWNQIEPRIAGLPLIAHNKAFDESCLKAVFRVYQMEYPDYEFYCTCMASRRVWPKGHHNLDVIAARCGYDLTKHHHALADAEACAAIALQIL